MNRRSSEVKNVLFISTAADMYGGERSLLDVVKRMSPAWRLHFVVPAPGRYMTALQELNYPFDVFDVPDYSGNGLRKSFVSRRTLKQFPSVLRLCRLIQARHIDLVHLNLHFAAPLVAAACALARVPLVVHARNMVEVQHDWLYRHLFRRARAIICISDAVLQGLVKGRLLSVEQAKRVPIIPDGRDLSPYGAGNRARIRREFKIEDNSPVVGIVARLEPMKGQDIFLRMAAMVAERLPKARFLVVGALMGEAFREYAQQLEKLQESLGLGERLIFTGYRKDIPDVLSALDCFVHPSRRGAFVSVLIEVMAAGVPIVASDVDGIPECVGRTGAGILPQTIEPSLFADAVIEILTDRERAEEMGAIGHERARQLYDIGPLAQRTEEIFLSCV